MMLLLSIFILYFISLLAFVRGMLQILVYPIVIQRIYSLFKHVTEKHPPVSFILFKILLKKKKFKTECKYDGKTETYCLNHMLNIILE